MPVMRGVPTSKHFMNYSFVAEAGSFWILYRLIKAICLRSGGDQETKLRKVERKTVSRMESIPVKKVRGKDFTDPIVLSFSSAFGSSLKLLTFYLFPNFAEMVKTIVIYGRYVHYFECP